MGSRREYAELMIPTRPGLLAALALSAAVVGWCVVGLVNALAGISLPVPRSAPTALAVIALSLFIWALLLRPRLLPQLNQRSVQGSGQRVSQKASIRPVSPFVAARTAALAMAASRTGALVGGFYLGVAVAFLPSWSVEAPRERVVVAVAAVVASVLLVAAALWLERICRLPDQPEGAEGDSGDGDDEAESTHWAYAVRPPNAAAGR